MRLFFSIWCIAAALWIGALFALAPYDLALTRWAHDARSSYAAFILHFGEKPSILLLVLAALGALRARRPESRFARHRPLMAAILIQGFTIPFLLTQLLKFFWGRVRFVHLASGRLYTPFYLPAGVGAGRSFPSGHAAMGAMGATIPFYLHGRVSPSLQALAWIVTLAWAAAVAYGRMVAGAHFITDTLFPAGLSYLVAPLLLRWMARLERKSEG